MRERQPNGEFVKLIKKKVKKAGEKAPSSILLDDLDKFANEDNQHRNTEEDVAAQSCIDDLAQPGGEVFVFTMANDVRCLPHSLRRSGRLVSEIEAESTDIDRVMLQTGAKEAQCQEFLALL